jgi:hypothetical protein
MRPFATPAWQGQQDSAYQINKLFLNRNILNIANLPAKSPTSSWAAEALYSPIIDQLSIKWDGVRQHISDRSAHCRLGRPTLPDRVQPTIVITVHAPSATVPR